MFVIRVYKKSTIKALEIGVCKKRSAILILRLKMFSYLQVTYIIPHYKNKFEHSFDTLLLFLWS